MGLGNYFDGRRRKARVRDMISHVDRYPGHPGSYSSLKSQSLGHKIEYREMDTGRVDKAIILAVGKGAYGEDLEFLENLFSQGLEALTFAELISGTNIFKGVPVRRIPSVPKTPIELVDVEIEEISSL